MWSSELYNRDVHYDQISAIGKGIAALVATAAAAQPYYPYYSQGYSYSYPGYSYPTYNYPTYDYPYGYSSYYGWPYSYQSPVTHRRRPIQTLMSRRVPIREARGRRRAGMLATDGRKAAS